MDRDSGLHESVRHDKAQFVVECACTVRNRAAVQATVLTDKESDVFVIKRRTKQGGALSSLLFNTVLQAALEDDLTCWREKRMGFRLGDQ